MDSHQTQEPPFPIVVCRRDERIEVLRQAGDGWTRTVLARRGRWPVWNPTRDEIAVSVGEDSAGQARGTIELYGVDGEHLRTLHASGPGAATVIAPGMPHYALWAPDGQTLSYVAQGSFGLSLFLSNEDGALTSNAIINAAPLFFSWCPDNNFLAVHAGTEFAVVETQGSRTTAEVTGQAIGFRTPAYSDDGEVLAYAVPGDPGVAVMRALFQGTQGREVWRFRGAVALAFRPGTRQLSVAVTRRPESGVFSELWQLDLAEEPSRAKRIARGPFVAAFWAPTGDRLALVVPTYAGDESLVVRVLAPDGSFIAACERLILSQDYRTLLAFFDQFVQSHHLWSPDGRWFLLAGRLSSDGVSASFGDAIEDYVMLWQPGRGRGLEVVTLGEIAFFPPRMLAPLQAGFG